MSLKDMMKEDLSVFYNTDEFAKKCLFEGREIAVLFEKNEMNIFDIPVERIRARKSDFEGLEEGKQLAIEGILYTIVNYSPEVDFQISIEIRKQNG